MTGSKDLEETNQPIEKDFFCCSIGGIKVFRDLQKLSPKEQTESVIVKSELALLKNSFLFPVENVTESNIEVITAENKEGVHQIYDFLYGIRHTQISLKITDKTLKEELEKIIPTLSEFKFNSFELDLYYSSRNVFSAIIDFLERYKHKSLNSFTIKVYSMREFDSLMQFFTQTVIHFKRIKLQLFTEVIVDLRGKVNKFRASKPLVDLIVENSIFKGTTFTLRDKVKAMIKSKHATVE